MAATDPSPIALGDFTLLPLSDGCFRLDGGAMFGVVPKTLWERRSPPDEKNRITLGLNALLLRRGTDVVLIDTGIGDKWDAKGSEIYAIQHTDRLLEGLARHGVKPEDVTHVVLTHLHFDHSGGSTRLDGAGRPVPTFPRARYFIQRGEWEFAMSGNPRSKASYFPENYEPLEGNRQVEFLEGDSRVLPGLRTVVTGGHTRYHQIVLIGEEGRRAVYWGDLIPTTAHLDYPYIMGYDLFPLDTLAAKMTWIPRALEEGMVCVWEHDPTIPVGRIGQEGKRIVVRPL